MHTSHPPLALTMGEAAGVGAEVTLKSWLARHERTLPAFAYLGDPALLERTAQALSIDVPIARIDNIAEATRHWPEALPALTVELQTLPDPSRPDPANAQATIRAIDLGVELVQAGAASGLVTNPVHKATLYRSGFAHPGHTEYLAKLAGGDRPAVMMLAVDDFRTVPVTVHVALSQAIRQLSSELIYSTGITVADSLKRHFGIASPRLAVSGLNPHAGESGTLGTEEVDIIAPAVRRLCDDGIDATGPLPADTMFHEEARARYDAALCMFHDQALIPIKTIGFDRGVNCTLGLPFIRTSPDHGTAFDIAGKGTASPESLIAALNMAGAMSARACDAQ